MLRRRYHANHFSRTSAVRALFCLLIIVALIGFLLVRRDRNKIQSLQSQVSKLSANQTSPKSPNSQSGSSTPTYYVELAPFGVSFPYVGPNITYTTLNPDSISIGLEGLDDPSATPQPSIDDACGVAALGIVTRSTTPQQSGVVTHIGSYYYAYSPNKNVCSTTTDIKNRILSTEETLTNSFRSLRAVDQP